MNALERTQYQVALAVSGAWKDTDRNKIYKELGWETLDQRRMFRRLVQFYKIMNVKTPDYLKIPIPSLQRQVGYHSTNVIAWNGISPVLRGAATSIFKKNILKVIRQMVLDDFSN